MSTNLVESTGEGSTRKRSTSPIRKYLVKSSVSPTTQKKPLTSSDDNIQPKKPDTTTMTTKTTNKDTAQHIAFQTFITKARKSVKEVNSHSSNDVKEKSFTSPNLKRSFSATSHLDSVNESWLQSPIDAKKKICNYDHLPVITDMPSAQLMMDKSRKVTLDFADSDSAGASKSYRQQLAHACGIVTGQRILSFNPKAPTARRADIRKNAPPTLEPVLHTSPSVKRHILSSPEKILDAPYMAEDYYRNVLDWSSKNVVAVALAKSIYLWNADSGDIAALNYDEGEDVTSLSWSTDGGYLAVGTEGGDTQIWDVRSNVKLRSMTGQEGSINALAWDKHVVSSGAYSGSIWHNDVRLANHKVQELNDHTDIVCGLKWRWDGQLLASGGNDSKVNIWDIRSNRPKHTKTNHVGAIKALSWCPWNHSMLATGGGRDDKMIYMWNVNTGARMSSITAGSQVTSIHWSQHYRELASTHGAPNNYVSIWSYPSCNKVMDISAHDTRILHASLSPDAQVLATVAADENLKFWRVFDHDGKAPLMESSASGQQIKKKNAQIQRARSIR